LKSFHIEEFDQYAINAILHKHGWRVRSKETFSERTVKTKLKEGHWAMRHVFWLDVVPGEGVLDEADEGEDGDPQDPPPSPDRLALPEATGG